jgi:hypothetical protein
MTSYQSRFLRVAEAPTTRVKINVEPDRSSFGQPDP